MDDHLRVMEIGTARSKSYTGKAILTFILYMFFWIPGFIANVIFYEESRSMSKIAGKELPGTGCLGGMLVIQLAAILVLVAIVFMAA